MNIDKLIQELILDEGYKYELYEDHLGFLTLGVGHLVLASDPEFKKSLGTTVSEERIMECLNNDIDTVCNELDRNMPWWKELEDDKMRVLANMCFNLGMTRLLKFKKFLAALEIGDFKTAGAEMLDSKWASQVGARATRLQRRIEL